MIVEYMGVPLLVIGEFVKGEPMELYDGDSTGYPGSSDSFNIEEVYVKDSVHNIVDILHGIEAIEALVKDKYYDN